MDALLCPPPIQNLWHVFAARNDPGAVRRQAVTQVLLHMARGIPNSRHAVDRIGSDMEAVHPFQYRHIERCCRGWFACTSPVNRPRVPVEGVDHWLVFCEDGLELRMGVAKFGGVSNEAGLAAGTPTIRRAGGYRGLKLRMSWPLRTEHRTCSKAFTPSRGPAHVAVALHALPNE